MATQVLEQAPAAADESQPAAKGKRLTMLLAIAGIVAGGTVGYLVVGPILAKRKAAAPVVAKHDAKPAAAIIHAVENIVLNPAGSGGTRFLMVTATFELKDVDAEQHMKEREAEIRDRLLALLGKRTVEELTEIDAREKIKQEVIESVSPMFAKGAIQKVFFPQFVIQ